MRTERIHENVQLKAKSRVSHLLMRKGGTRSSLWIQKFEETVSGLMKEIKCLTKACQKLYWPILTTDFRPLETRLYIWQGFGTSSLVRYFMFVFYVKLMTCLFQENFSEGFVSSWKISCNLLIVLTAVLCSFYCDLRVYLQIMFYYLWSTVGENSTKINAGERSLKTSA